MTLTRSLPVSAIALGLFALSRVSYAQASGEHPADKTAPAHAEVHVGAEAQHAGPEAGHHGEHGEHAEHGEHEEGEEHRGYAGVDAVFGFGRWSGNGTTRPGIYSFVLGGHYEVSPGFALGARLPLSYGIARTSSDTNSAAFSVGNVELAAEYETHPTANHALAVPIELGLALPTASGDEFSRSDPSFDANSPRLRAAVNAAASASRGGEESALFASHRLGIVPRIGLDYEAGDLDLAAYTKLEILRRVGGDLPDLAEGRQNKTAVEWITGVSGFYNVVPHMLAVGTRAWIAYSARREIEPRVEVDMPSRAQLVLEPGVRATLGAFRPSVSYILPVGGELHTAGYGGVRVVAGGVF